eukprot:5823142-Amphidinium_carterae.1
MGTVGRVDLLHLDELDAEYGRGVWLPVSRFVISQSSGGKRKLRLIDDFSMFGHNGTTRAAEKLDHGGIDEIVA